MGIRLAAVFAVAFAGCSFAVTGLTIGGGSPDDLGVPGDLAGPRQDLPGGGDADLSASDLSSVADLRGAVDLAGSPDLPAPPDLLVPPDLLPTCTLPSIPATVGPGPSLAITLSNVRVAGGGNTAHVLPGVTFSLKADYSLSDNGNNVDQILIGFAPPNAPAACLFDGTVHGGGASGTATVNLIAPTAPGLYTLRFHYGQALSCDFGWWTINGAPTSSEDFAAICVP